MFSNEGEKFLVCVVNGDETWMKWKSIQWCESILVHQNQRNSDKTFHGRKLMATFFFEWGGQKRCFFADGIHECRSNSHIGSVLWDVETIKQGDLKQTAWPTNFGSCVVAWQHVTPHCCMHSPAAQAIQVGIFWPSTVQSGPGPYHFHLFLHLATLLALQNFMDGKDLKQQWKTGWTHRWQPCMMRGYKSWYPAMISASILAVNVEK
jgi:hypothetical protein